MIHHQMKTKLWVVLPTVLLPLLLCAQPQQKKYRLEEAVQLGLANSKQLKLDSARFTQTQVKQDQVKDYALPDVRVNASYTRLSDITPVSFQFPGSPEPVTLLPNIPNTYGLSASVREGIFTGFKLKYTQESYGFLTKAAALDVDKDRDEVRLNIISAYIAYVKLQLSNAIITENLTAAKQRVEEVTSMRDRGLATDNDVLKAQLYQSNLELSANDAGSSISVAQFNMGILLGLQPGTMFDADTTGLFQAVSLKPEEAYEQDAKTARNDVKALGYRLQASQSGIKVAQAGYYPTLNLAADYLDARPNQRIFPLQDKFTSTWDVGLTLSWNLTSLYTTKHSLQDARIQQQMTQFQAEQLNDNIRAEIFQGYASCQNALNKTNTLNLAVKQANENSRQVKAKYDQQVALMSDVLDADAALLQTRINLVMQRADLQLAYFRLEKSTGTLK